MKKLLAVLITTALVFGTGVLVLAEAGDASAIDDETAETVLAEESQTEDIAPASEDQTDDTEGEAPAAEGEAPAAEAEANAEGEPAAEEAIAKSAEDPLEGCDFTVTGDTANYSFDRTTGVLTITGDVTVAMKDGGTGTSQRIVVADDAVVTIQDLTINAAGGPAIKVQAGVAATVTLEGTSDLTGAENYAAIESGWDDETLATLTINGDGTLNANGGNRAAAIGGSYTNKNAQGTNISSYCGNIVIESGTIIARGGGSGAGIGSAGNNNRNWDGSSNTSASFKMQYHTLGDITITGGNVTAYAGGEGAGIGGGNHTDTGQITIGGDAVVAAYGSGSGAGIGNGCGSSVNKGGDGEKGPGEFVAYVTIEGNADVKAYGDRNGAGIGGGMYCDAVVTITGGTVEAVGGHGDNGSYHHGGAGIGGGYVGHADIEITGGNITASAGEKSGAAGIGSGGTANQNPSRGRYTGRTGSDLLLSQTSVTISNTPVIQATGGEYGGAGIGAGTGSDKVSVSISGGKIIAEGGKSEESKKLGGAGIGGGLRGSEATTGKADYYFTDTDVDVTITGGDVLAIGGWGASGVGSGANNKMAETITLDLAAPGKDGGAELVAYADGTKFAIDTRDVTGDGGDGTTTTSHTDGRTITGSILQGTFVRHYTSEDHVDQTTEGLSSIQIINDKTGASKELTTMPDGYRSFATNVDKPGVYSIYSDAEEIADGGGRYFNKCTDETRTDEDVETAKDVEERNVQYQAKEGELCDNFYLFPVKTVVVTKDVAADEALMDSIDHTVYFALWNDAKEVQDYVRKRDGSIWIESVEIVNGEPQGTAAFSGIDEGLYSVSEIDPDLVAQYEAGKIGDIRLTPGTPIEGNDNLSIVKIETRHGDSDDNDAEISDEIWTDKVTVANTYEYTNPSEDPKDPTPADPAGTTDPEPPAKQDKPHTGDTLTAFYAALLMVDSMLLMLVLRRLRRKGASTH